MNPDEPNQEERQEELAEDNGTPFQPTDSSLDDTRAANDIAAQAEKAHLDDTHPSTDSASDLQDHEVYDEGLAGAAEASEPNAGNTVVSYEPPEHEDEA